MAAWIWLSTLFSFALLVFLLIAGKETPRAFLRSVPIYVYGLAVASTVVGLIGAILQHGMTSTYLFSLFGLPYHEGFRVTVVTSILNLLLYAVALATRLKPLMHKLVLRPTVDGWTSQGTWRVPGPEETAGLRIDDSGTSEGHDSFVVARRLAWWTFTLSLLILSPTLSESAFVLYVIILVVGWPLVHFARTVHRKELLYHVAIYVVLCLGIVGQTSATWSAWHNVQTVQLSRLHHAGVNATMWHSPEAVLWLGIVGFLLQSAAITIAYWKPLTTFANASTVTHPSAQTNLLPTATFLGIASLLYLRTIAPFVIVHGWQWIVLIVEVIIAAMPVMILAFGWRIRKAVK